MSAQNNIDEALAAVTSVIENQEWPQYDKETAIVGITKAYEDLTGPIDYVFALQGLQIGMDPDTHIAIQFYEKVALSLANPDYDALPNIDTVRSYAESGIYSANSAGNTEIEQNSPAGAIDALVNTADDIVDAAKGTKDTLDNITDPKALWPIAVLAIIAFLATR